MEKSQQMNSETNPFKSMIQSWVEHLLLTPLDSLPLESVISYGKMDSRSLQIKYWSILTYKIKTNLWNQYSNNSRHSSNKNNRCSSSKWRIKRLLTKACNLKR